MTAKARKDVSERVETWPEEAQQELAEIAREIDADLGGGAAPVRVSLRASTGD